MANIQVTDIFSTLQTDPIRNFKFLVQIAHRVNGSSQPINFNLGFTSVSGLSVSTTALPYRQGGYNTTTQQIPGQTQFQPVTMQRGLLFGSPYEWDWMRQIYSVNVGQGSGLDTSAGGIGTFRANVTVHVLEHPAANTVSPNVSAVFRIYNAWPSAISFSDLNAGDNAFLVESMTLVHEGFDYRLASGPGATVNSDVVFSH